MVNAKPPPNRASITNWTYNRLLLRFWLPAIFWSMTNPSPKKIGTGGIPAAGIFGQENTAEEAA
jgi:hypothetical protein